MGTNVLSTTRSVVGVPAVKLFKASIAYNVDDLAASFYDPRLFNEFSTIIQL